MISLVESILGGRAQSIGRSKRSIPEYPYNFLDEVLGSHSSVSIFNQGENEKTLKNIFNINFDKDGASTHIGLSRNTIRSLHKDGDHVVSIFTHTIEVYYSLNINARGNKRKLAFEQFIADKDSIIGWLKEFGARYQIIRYEDNNSHPCIKISIQEVK